MHTKDKDIELLEIRSLEPHLWVKKHADYLYAYAAVRINDEELARDLVQETFLAALERLEAFQGRSSERTWLTAILKNKIVDVYRKKSSAIVKNMDMLVDKEDNVGFFDADNGHWNNEHQPGCFGIEELNALENKEFQSILEACMEKLPALWSSVFTMKHVDEESSETICTALKLTSSNFWVIIHRAKVNLRSCLQRNWI